MKCANVMFFNFWAFFLKMYIFAVAIFFLPNTCPVNSSFSVVVQICIIYVLMKHFFLLATVAIVTENVTFLLFPW